MKDLRSEIKRLSYDLDLIELEECSAEEIKEFSKLKKDKQPLPDCIISEGPGFFYRVKENDLNNDELETLLTLRRTKYLRTIKNCALFFAIMSVFSILVFFILSKFI